MKTIVNYSKYYIHDNNVYNIKNEKMSLYKSTNESFIYRNNKKFSEFLHCGLSSIQNALLKNVKRCRGFEFEYLDFFYEVGHEIVKL
jgi:hypothetical protein